MALLAESSISAGNDALEAVQRTGEALSTSQPANRSSVGLSSRSKTVTRGAGCGSPARPDLQGGRGGNSSVYPTGAPPCASLLEHVVDDAHDDRAHRRVRGVEYLPRAVAFVQDDDRLAGAGADGIESDQVVAVLPLDDQHALPFVEAVFDRAVDLADDRAQDHWTFTPSTRAMMAWSTGTNVRSSASAASRPPSYDTSSPGPA